MFELTVRAFNLSEKYRTPVILWADETVRAVLTAVFAQEAEKAITMQSLANCLSWFTASVFSRYVCFLVTNVCL
jgi:TPP-dependent indolepyruvate ferredoxin oxidoreductase alpha subunit